MAIVLGVPELRAAMLDQFTSAMQLLAEVVAERAGRPVYDWRVRTLAGAVIGIAMAVMITIAEDTLEGLRRDPRRGDGAPRA